MIKSSYELNIIYRTIAQTPGNIFSTTKLYAVAKTLQYSLVGLQLLSLQIILTSLSFDPGKAWY